MPAPKFNHPDLVQVLPFREYLRQHMPTAQEGYVVEDLDLALRVYQPNKPTPFNFQTDAEGKLRLIELKYGKAWITPGQQRTFGLIDKLMRLGDPNKERYLGYFVVQYSAEDWEHSMFKINGKPVDRDTFHRFLMFEDVGICGLFDKDGGVTR